MSEAEVRAAPVRARPAEDGLVPAPVVARNREAALRKEAEHERDAAAARAAEAARRAAMARREAAEQRTRAEEAQARMEEAEATAHRARAELAELARERDALLRSTSWRMTAPLRAVARWVPAALRKFFRGGRRAGS